MAVTTQEEFDRVALAIVFEDTQYGCAMRTLYGYDGHRLFALDKEKATLAFFRANRLLKTFF